MQSQLQRSLDRKEVVRCTVVATSHAVLLTPSMGPFTAVLGDRTSSGSPSELTSAS
jgi:hypothetical protein